MASVVQSVKVTGVGVITLTTGAITTSSDNTFVVACSSGVGVNPGTPSDSKNNEYSFVFADRITITDGLGSEARWYKKIAGVGGSGHTFTQTWALSTNAVLLGIELSGISEVDTGSQNDAQDGASPFTVTSNEFAQPKELVLALCVTSSVSNPATFAESTGFSLVAEETNGLSGLSPISVYFKLITNTSPLTPSWTNAGASAAGLIICGFFASILGMETFRIVNEEEALGARAMLNTNAWV
jgi:hypothetical protein